MKRWYLLVASSLWSYFYPSFLLTNKDWLKDNLFFNSCSLLINRKLTSRTGERRCKSKINHYCQVLTGRNIILKDTYSRISLYSLCELGRVYRVVNKHKNLLSAILSWLEQIANDCLFPTTSSKSLPTG